MSIGMKKLKGEDDLHTFLLNLSACLLQNQLRVRGMTVGTHIVSWTVALITAAVLREVSHWEDQCRLWHWASRHTVFTGKEYMVNTSFLSPTRKDTRSSLHLCSKDTSSHSPSTSRAMTIPWHSTSCVSQEIMLFHYTDDITSLDLTRKQQLSYRNMHATSWDWGQWIPDSYKWITSDPNAPFWTTSVEILENLGTLIPFQWVY